MVHSCLRFEAKTLTDILLQLKLFNNQVLIVFTRIYFAFWFLLHIYICIAFVKLIQYTKREAIWYTIFWTGQKAIYCQKRRKYLRHACVSKTIPCGRRTLSNTRPLWTISFSSRVFAWISMANTTILYCVRVAFHLSSITAQDSQGRMKSTRHWSNTKTDFTILSSS